MQLRVKFIWWLSYSNFCNKYISTAHGDTRKRKFICRFEVYEKSLNFSLKPVPTRLLIYLHLLLSLTVCCCSFPHEEGFEWHVLVATTLDIQQVRKEDVRLLICCISASTFKGPFVLEIGYTYLIPFFINRLPSTEKSEDQWKNGFLSMEVGCVQDANIFQAIRKLLLVSFTIVTVVLKIPRKEPQLEWNERGFA